MTMPAGRVMARGVTPTVPSLAYKPAPSVQAVQATLRRYGVPSSPLETYALTTIGATRDVSLRAQMKPAFQSMNPQTQANMIVMSEAVEKKAEEISPEEEKAEENAEEKAEETTEAKAE